jgi:hypothetical protein
MLTEALSDLVDIFFEEVNENICFQLIYLSFFIIYQTVNDPHQLEQKVARFSFEPLRLP